MSTARRLLGTSALVLGGSLFSRLTGAVVVLGLARVAGREALGAFAFVQSYVGIVIGLAELGLTQIVVREVARERPDAARVVGNAVWIRGAVAFPVGALAGVGLFRLSEAPGLAWMALAAGLWLAISVAGPLTAVFRARIDMRLPVTVNAVANVLYAVAGVLGIWLVAEAWPVYLSLAVTSAGALAVLAVLGARRLRPELGFDAGLSRELLASGLPLALNALLMVIYHRVDQVMLQGFLGAEEVGLYAASVKLVEVSNVVPLAVMTAVFPALSRYARQDRARYDDLLRRTVQLLAAAVLLALPYAWMHGGWALELLFGADFRAGADALTVLMAAELFLFFLFVFRDALVSDGLERLALVFSMVTMLANVGLNLLLIPVLGIVGAAWATLGALASVLLLAGAFASTRRYAGIAARAGWRPLLSALATTATLAALGPWPVAGGIAGVVVFGVGMVALGAFDDTDRALALSVWRRVRGER